jgi:hypothetical protein
MEESLGEINNKKLVYNNKKNTIYDFNYFVIYSQYNYLLKSPTLDIR